MARAWVVWVFLLLMTAQSADAREDVEILVDVEIDVQAEDARQARRLAVDVVAPRRAIMRALKRLGAPAPVVDGLSFTDERVLDTVIDFTTEAEAFQDKRYLGRLRYRLRPDMLGEILRGIEPDALSQ